MKMRDKILATATSLFESRGIQASGVDTIIAESGIAKATLYRHFPSKNLLITAYLREKSDRFYAWLNLRLSSKKANSLEILIELCELVEQWIMTPEFHGLPFHIASIEFPDPAHPINQYSAVLAVELQGYLSKIAASAGAKDPEALGQQLTILFEGAALVERLSPGVGAAKRAKNAAVTLIRASV
ncbi:HTH-type transcriptional regulator YjdC [mine drainage metagenome]|uniref:HTH-type transcriptional regulator YjdC n=1 Tax=mine drainage metagenome TaxID=410659 RepID=A0A1J5QNR7_9ZZZZ